MKRIGITQRVEEVASYKERRDCLDQNWSVLIEKLGMLPLPIPNNLSRPMEYIKNSDFDGFILTGGNDLSKLENASNPAPERDLTEYYILKYAEYNYIPVIGVCRGFHVMNDYFSGEQILVEQHVAKYHKVYSKRDNEIFSFFKEVNSYHNWGIEPEGLGTGLEAVIFAEDGTVEAVCHEKLPWISIMWHPERESPFLNEDLKLIKSVLGG